MTKIENSRREFLKNAALGAGGLILAPEKGLLRAAGLAQVETAAPGYKIHIRDSVVEIAPKRFISTVTYNGQFPGPLLRFKEGEPVTVAIFNDTETPEQLHWHGQKSWDRSGWRGGRRHAVYSRAWSAHHQLHTKSSGDAFLSHTQSRRGKSGGRAVQRRSGAGVYRAKRKSWALRSGDFSDVEGIRADAEPGRRHGAGFSGWRER